MMAAINLHLAGAKILNTFFTAICQSFQNKGSAVADKFTSFCCPSKITQKHLDQLLTATFTQCLNNFNMAASHSFTWKQFINM